MDPLSVLAVVGLAKMVSWRREFSWVTAMEVRGLLLREMVKKFSLKWSKKKKH